MTKDDGGPAAADTKAAGGETSGAAMPAVNQMAPVWAWGVVLFAGGIWGATFALAKIATHLGAHPLGLTLWQAVLGGLMLFAFDAARRRRLPLEVRHLKFYTVCGLLGTAIPGALYFYAAVHVPAGVLSITVATVPILTFVAALLCRIEGMAMGRIAGVVLGIAAVVLIAAPETSLPDPAAAPWVLVAIVASACYAGETMYITMRRPEGSDSITLLRGMLTMAALVLAPIVVATDSFVPLAWPPTEIEFAVFAMAIINAIAYGLFIYLVTRAGPVFASQCAYVVTLSGVFWGIAIFGERHSPWIWGALVLMMAGLALVKPRDGGP